MEIYNFEYGTEVFKNINNDIYFVWFSINNIIIMIWEWWIKVGIIITLKKCVKIILKSSLRKKFYKFKLIKITLGNGYNIISKNYNNLNIL